jgi:hypothetical protein
MNNRPVSTMKRFKLIASQAQKWLGFERYVAYPLPNVRWIKVQSDIPSLPPTSPN